MEMLGVLKPWGCCPPSNPGNLQFSCSSHFFLFLPWLTACWHPLLLPFVLPPQPFSFFRSLSWKIIIARWVFFLIIIIIILWPGAFGSRGIFHPKGKDIPFTVKKVYIWCLFPPPAQIESSSIWGREAKPCWRERRCQRCFLRPGGAVSIPPPSSLVLSPT